MIRTHVLAALLIFSISSHHAAGGDDVIWREGDTVITTNWLMLHVRGGIEDERVENLIIRAGTNLYPAIVTFFTNSTDHLLVLQALGIIRSHPDLLESVRPTLLRYIANTNIKSDLFVSSFERIAQPGDEKLLALQLYSTNRWPIFAAARALEKLGTPAALNELVKALPELERKVGLVPQGDQPIIVAKGLTIYSGIVERVRAKVATSALRTTEVPPPSASPAAVPAHSQTPQANGPETDVAAPASEISPVKQFWTFAAGALVLLLAAVAVRQFRTRR